MLDWTEYTDKQLKARSSALHETMQWLDSMLTAGRGMVEVSLVALMILHFEKIALENLTISKK